MLAIVGASGKIGFATLSALLKYKLLPPEQIVACTSSTQGSSTWQKLAKTGVHVRHADFEDPSSMGQAFSGANALYLVSSPKIEMDYHDAPRGKGREAHHFAAIDAARNVGVRHIYYTSLAFARPSVAGVMRAHIRTEEYFEALSDGTTWTFLREGLYNESWPLYLGYYNLPDDDRKNLVVAGDGLLSWTAIDDLGLGSALVLTAPKEQYAGKTVSLSTALNIMKLEDVATLVADARGRPLQLTIVPRKEYEQYYVQERGMDLGAVEWWSTSYGAIAAGETHVVDATLDDLLASRGVSSQDMKTTVHGMIQSSTVV